jgi:hypothetical protein
MVALYPALSGSFRLIPMSAGTIKTWFLPGQFPGHFVRVFPATMTGRRAVVPVFRVPAVFPAKMAGSASSTGWKGATRQFSRQTVARQVNSALVLLYWRVGWRIRRDFLKEKRAEYGERIVATLSRRLTEEFGIGWLRRNFFNMIRFVETFPNRKIVHALRAQLVWTQP